MSAPVETVPPAREANIGGGIDPGRLLSVGQLQSALRTARHETVQGGGVGSEALAAVGGDDRGESLRDSGAEDRGRPARVRRSGIRASLLKSCGLHDLGRLPWARRQRRPGGTPAGVPKISVVWAVPHREWTGSLYDRARRWVVLATAVMLLVVGAVTVTDRVVAMVDPPPVTAAAAPRVSDVRFAGAAQAAAWDYLSWDAAAPRVARAAALSEWGVTGSAVDGWDGSGQLSIENAIPVSVVRIGEDRAIVTIQARTSGSPSSGAAAPATSITVSSRAAGSATWLTLAVPVLLRGSRVILTARPALVGSPPTEALGPAVPSAADEDTDTGQATAPTVNKLITAYGSGDLEFVRGPGSDFTGLGGMVTSGRVESWRMAKLPTGGDPATRAGDVTVLWTLPGGAGQLRCSYRIQLVQRENRWLLQQITPAVGTS